MDYSHMKSHSLSLSLFFLSFSLSLSLFFSLSVSLSLCLSLPIPYSFTPLYFYIRISLFLYLYSFIVFVYFLCLSFSLSFSFSISSSLVVGLTSICPLLGLNLLSLYFKKKKHFWETEKEKFVTLHRLAKPQMFVKLIFPVAILSDLSFLTKAIYKNNQSNVPHLEHQVFKSFWKNFGNLQY